MIKTKKRGLGKGLEALIPDMIIDIIEGNKNEEKVEMLPLNKIYNNPDQPRKKFNDKTIDELSKSIKSHGIIQPIIVTKKEDTYIIIAGERRYKAANMIGLKEVPCIVKNYDPRQLLEVSLIENLQREDLNIIEEARAYNHIIKQYNVTQEDLSEALGKSRPYISNCVRLLRLDERIIDFIIEGELTGGHGRAILGIESHENQFQLAQKIIDEGLNVREVEELVKSLSSNNQKIEKKKSSPNKDIFIVEIEENLKSLFGTKVNIVNGAKKGKIEIEYYNDDDLERILGLLK